MFHYVYITTNLVNGKQYVGDHSSKKEKDSYYGSGKLIQKALYKYSKNNFKVEILEYFDSKEKAFFAQEKYINEYNTLIPNGYNISPAGGLQCSHGWSKEQRQAISDQQKGQIGRNKGSKWSNEAKQRLSEAHKGKIHSEETKKKMSLAHSGEKNTWRGKHHTIESKQKISEAQTRKIVSEKTKEKHRQYRVSEETKEKISNAQIGRIPWNKGKKFKNNERN